MSAWLEAAALVAVIAALTPLLGGYFLAIYDSRPHSARRILGGLERAIYRLCRIDPEAEMSVDLTRSLIYVLAPISIVGALVFVQQGEPQNWRRRAARTLRSSP